MKKFLICLSLLFSFIFIGNVKALNVSYQGYTIDDNVLDNIWSQIDGKKLSQMPNPYDYSGNNNIFYRVDYPYLSINKSRNSSKITFKFFKSIDSFEYSSSDYTVWINSNNKNNFLTIEYNMSNNQITWSSAGQALSANKFYSVIYYNYKSNVGYEKSINNFDLRLNSSILWSKSFDYNSNPQPNTFNFHLNGGWVRDPRDNWGSEEDFSFSLYPNEVEDFFTNLEVNKLTMVFDGWYYDSKFNRPFNISDSINDDVDLYAKFRYEKVDDFLKNTTFNQYTFDTLYDYAIITKGNNSGDIYLGLNVNKYDITVYEYKENLLSYDNERGFCLTPMYSKNGTYYYLLDTTKTLDTEVLILPKSTFENNNYDFLLTDNAYITYTNNLEETTIYDSSGNQITTNLQDTYQKFQDSMIDDETDLLTIFKKLINLKDNNIFNNITVIWNKLKSTAIYNYLMILIVGALIILIVKSAKRK